MRIVNSNANFIKWKKNNKFQTVFQIIKWKKNNKFPRDRFTTNFNSVYIFCWFYYNF